MLILIFSSNQEALARPRKLIKNEKTHQINEFQYLGSQITWDDISKKEIQDRSYQAEIALN